MTGDLQPGEVRYIKLGRGGAWASEAIRAGTIPVGYHQIQPEICVFPEGRGTIWQRFRDAGRTPAGATHGVRELEDFYTLPADALWVTIANGHLWWAFAEPEVISHPTTDHDRPTRHRRTIDGWQNTTLTGEALTVRSLSSSLTQMANFRMTICRVGKMEYLLRRIRGEDDPLRRRSIALQAEMTDLTLAMIRQLHWREFETLVDLIFARGGWRRTSLLGEDMADVDLVLEQPVTGETAWVQVKTGTRQTELEEYLGRFWRDGSFDRFFFVCHSAPGPLHLPPEPRLHLWEGIRIAEVAIEVGLFPWLMERTR